MGIYHGIGFPSQYIKSGWRYLSWRRCVTSLNFSDSVRVGISVLSFCGCSSLCKWFFDTGSKQFDGFSLSLSNGPTSHLFSVYCTGGERYCFQSMINDEALDFSISHLPLGSLQYLYLCLDQKHPRSCSFQNISPKKRDPELRVWEFTQWRHEHF